MSKKLIQIIKDCSTDAQILKRIQNKRGCNLLYNNFKIFQFKENLKNILRCNLTDEI